MRGIYSTLLFSLPVMVLNTSSSLLKQVKTVNSADLHIFLCIVQLLQNLEYSEAVSVHLVNNGQEMMSANEWNLKKILS